MSIDLKNKTINQRIKYFRLLCGYTQSDVAEILNMKVSTYSQKERKSLIDAQFLIKISKIFDVDVRMILFGELPEKETSVKSNKKPDTQYNLPLKPKEYRLIAMARNLKKSDFEKVYEFTYNLFYNKKTK